MADLLEHDAELAAEFADDGLVPKAGLPAPDFEPDPEDEEEPVPFSHVDPGTPEPIVPESIDHGKILGAEPEPESEPEPEPEPEDEAE